MPSLEKNKDTKSYVFNTLFSLQITNPFVFKLIKTEGPTEFVWVACSELLQYSHQQIPNLHHPSSVPSSSPRKSSIRCWLTDHFTPPTGLNFKRDFKGLSPNCQDLRCKLTVLKLLSVLFFSFSVRVVTWPVSCPVGILLTPVGILEFYFMNLWLIVKWLLN